MHLIYGFVGSYQLSKFRGTTDLVVALERLEAVEKVTAMFTITD